jgi:hypothetical protein
MSYLDKISQLHDKVNQARESAQSFEDKIKNDAFTTAEAKKNDLIGHIARHYEDIGNHLQTASEVAFTTGHAIKHGKAAVKAIKDFRAKRAAAAQPESRPGAGTEPSGTTAPGEPTPPAGGAQPTPPAGESEPAGAAAVPDRPPVPEQPVVTQAAEPREVDAFETPGLDALPAAYRNATPEGEALRSYLRTGSEDPPPTRSAQAQQFQDRVAELNRTPEVGDGQGPVAPRPTGEGDVPNPTPPAPEAPLTETTEAGTEGLLSGFADTALGAIPVIGDLAAVGLIIDQAVEGAKGAKKVEEAEETGPGSAPGTTIASTGVDARNLGRQ